MDIYKFDLDSNKYHGLIYPDDSTDDIFDSFEGQSLIGTWVPVVMEVDETQEKGDFPSFEVPIISERAWKVLQPLINKDVEALQVTVEQEYFGEMGGQYFALNVISIIACLDEQKSEFVRYSDGSIMRVSKYVFLPDRLKDIHFFKIRAEDNVFSHYEFYVSEEFKNLVELHELKGLFFSKVNE